MAELFWWKSKPKHGELHITENGKPNFKSTAKGTFLVPYHEGLRKYCVGIISTASGWTTVWEDEPRAIEEDCTTIEKFDAYVAFLREKVPSFTSDVVPAEVEVDQ